MHADRHMSIGVYTMFWTLTKYSNMAIRIKTNNPDLILKEIIYRIDASFIKTWKYDEDGDFTCTDEQWINRAWFRPHTFADEKQLIFAIIGRNDVNLSMAEFSLYHGKFIEMLVSHLYGIYEHLEILPKGNHFDPSEID